MINSLPGSQNYSLKRMEQGGGTRTLLQAKQVWSRQNTSSGHKIQELILVKFTSKNSSWWNSHRIYKLRFCIPGRFILQDSMFISFHFNLIWQFFFLIKIFFILFNSSVFQVKTYLSQNLLIMFKHFQTISNFFKFY